MMMKRRVMRESGRKPLARLPGSSVLHSMSRTGSRVCLSQHSYAIKLGLYGTIRDNGSLIKKCSIAGTLPVLLVLSTVLTLCLSWLITKSGPVRYLFGLPTPPSSLLPGHRARGFLPLCLLALLFIIMAAVVNCL